VAGPASSQHAFGGAEAGGRERGADEHSSSVEAVREQVRRFAAARTTARIYHKTTNSTRAQEFRRDAMIDTGGLDRVLHVDRERRVAVVEPNVPMDALVDATLPLGLVPPVVPEFPGITVGGAVQGGAGESSSFRHGLFHDTCLEYEIVLGDGTLVTASREENGDVFWGMACAYGSLGVLTRVTVGLVDAAPYVRLRYERVGAYAEAVDRLRAAVKAGVGFVDAVVLGPSRGVVVSGDLAHSAAGLRVATFTGRRDPWFHRHAERIGADREELVPLRDYLFRYDRGAFWMGRDALRYVHLPDSAAVRAALDPLLRARRLYALLHATNISQDFFVQDLSMPAGSTVEMLALLGRHVGVSPLWLCPLRPAGEDRLAPSALDADLVVNIGAWGAFRRPPAEFVRVNRLIEREVARLGGRKVLYAHAYSTPEELWRIYDRQWYAGLRLRCRADPVFPDLYEKVAVRDAYRRPALAKGIWRGLRRGALPAA